MIEWRRSASVAMSAIIDARTSSSSSAPRDWSNRAFPKIVVTGVRSSCETRPRNSSLTAFDASSARRSRADRLFGSVALGDVDEDVDRADELPVVVEQRSRVGHERDVGAVGPDRDGLPAPDGTRFLEGDRHRTLVVAHRALVEEQQPERPAPFLADRRPAAPELGCGGVEERDLAVRIGRVDRDSEGIEEAAIAFGATLRRPRRRLARSDAPCRPR